MDQGNVYYARREGLVVFKFRGDIRYMMGGAHHVSASLNALLDRLFEAADFDNVLIDLTETKNIDSTNLGLLAKIARFTIEHQGRKPTILSTNPDIDTILGCVGFDQVFNIVHDTAAPDLSLEALPSPTGADIDLTRLVLEAHQALVELSDENKETFRNVIDVLENQLGDTPPD